MRNIWIIGLLLAVFGGCTRAQYRRQADCEVYNLVDRAGYDPRWRIEDYTIRPNPESRFFDPRCPDRPPMPPDDPTSHKLMHCVDCKKGWPCWHKCYGRTRCVENPGWKQFLPYDAQGNVVLDRQAAVELALVYSRDYQRELEYLYLSALDVTFQRFRFDVQFFGSHSTFFTAQGPVRAGTPSGSSTLEVHNSIEARKLTATGGELVTGLANSLVWQFAGPDTYAAASLLDFSLVQPLLRGAGRAVVLENLTQSERTLLANVRQLEQFRRYFYAQIVSGRSTVVGPARGLLTVQGLIPPLPPAGSGGLYSLLADQVRIRNQQLNVELLRNSVRMFEDYERVGRTNKFQLDFTRQALYNAQSQLLLITNNYQDRLDAYKVTLGLPPDLDARIDDPLLRQFDLVDPTLAATQQAVRRMLEEAREAAAGSTVDVAPKAGEAGRKLAAILKMVRGDMLAMEKALPLRRADLHRLSARPEVAQGAVDLSAVSVEALEERAKVMRADFAAAQQEAAVVLQALERLEQAASRGEQALRSAEELAAALARVGALLSELSLTQARARLETARLVPVSLDPREALKTACENRLDWMNARAALVDVWRQVEVTANALRGDLSVRLSGDLGTTGNNPLRFRGTTGQLRAGVQFDPPLTRLAERNQYREALIDYQQARRTYMAFEDRVNQNLRETLRTLTTAQIDFELRRAGVRVAIAQVEFTTLRTSEPPRGGEAGKISPGLGDTAARDLVGALSGLLSAQNSFVGQWIDYETQRLTLDLELGTMQLDCHGMWVDPGPIEERAGSAAPRPEGARPRKAQPMPVPAPVPPPAPTPGPPPGRQRVAVPEPAAAL